MLVIVHTIPMFTEDIVDWGVVFSKFSKEGEGSTDSVLLSGLQHILTEDVVHGFQFFNYMGGYFLRLKWLMSL